MRGEQIQRSTGLARPRTMTALAALAPAALFLSIGLAPAGPALAELCSLDAVPAATLLLPYFEVDLDDPAGVTTFFSINNAEGAPALAHVVFWTDWSYPTLAFDVYLTGYDVVSINVRDVFEGKIPMTADAPNDPQQADAATRCGVRSPCGGVHSENRHWDDANAEDAGEQGFPFCDQVLPAYDNPVLVSEALDVLVRSHTGRAVAALDACVGEDYGDNVARGYVTVDSVSECSLALRPTDAGLGGTPYFVDGGLGVANDRNQLWGDWSLVDPTNHFAQGDTLAHIEAHDEFDAARIPLIHPATRETAMVVDQVTGRTFYGRYFQDPADGRDNREPLGTIWAARYLNGPAFDDTQFLVWRDPNAVDLEPVPNGEPDAWCTSRPSWFPVNETEVLAFNESEDAVEVCRFAGGVITPDFEDPACFPWATGRYGAGAFPLDVPFNFGWMYLDLNVAMPDLSGDPFAMTEGEIAQSYVTAIHRALGTYSVGLQAVELHDACEDVLGHLNGTVENGDMNVIPFF